MNSFEDIYNETYDKILNFVISKCDNITNVSDIMQNIYFDFYKTISLKGSTYVKDYNKFLYKLAKVQIFKYYRLKNKFKILFVEDYNYVDSEIDSDSLGYEIEKKVFNNIASEKIWDEIKKEKLIVQKILAFYFLQDLSIKRISIILKMNESSVKNNLYRTIKKLKNKFLL